MAVNTVAVRRLLDALRSGNYVQGRGSLGYSIDGEFNYCCEGVACEIFTQELGLIRTVRADSYGSQVLSFNSSGGLSPRVVGDHLGFELQDDFEGWLVRIPPIRDSWYAQEKEFDMPVAAASLNDEYKFSFNQIADLIEWYYLNGGNGSPV